MATPQHASRDINRVTTLLGVSNVDGLTPVVLEADPVTGRLLVSAVVTTGGVTTGNLATNQVSVASTATLIAAARTTRADVTIVNGGTTDVYLGNSSSVTTATGILLIGVKGAAITLDVTSDVYGIVATGSQTVSYAEEYS